MLSKDLFLKIKQLHKETGAGMMFCRYILEKHGSNYENAKAYINSGEYREILGSGVRRSEPIGYEELCREIRQYNWNDGFSFPQFVLNHPECDLALAMEIFYDADGYRYFRILSYNIGGAIVWLKFIGKLYEDIEQGRYSKRKGTYKIPLTEVQKYQLIRRAFPDVFFQDIGETQI